MDDSSAFENEKNLPVARQRSADPYVMLARQSVEAFVRTGHPLKTPENLPGDLLTGKAGVFVSLHEADALRGCIGTIDPVCDCLADEIIRNGVYACSEDPRFPPVQENELEKLVYGVDVLFEPEPIDSSAGLDPLRYGVIVSKGCRRGLLLPNLEGIDTVEMQIRIAKQKAGIEPEEICRLERFEVIRHE
ncbi:MAG: AmmeMemoRadiSam system protein A [Raoultibacter sp.]